MSDKPISVNLIMPGSFGDDDAELVLQYGESWYVFLTVYPDGCEIGMSYPDAVRLANAILSKEALIDESNLPCDSLHPRGNPRGHGIGYLTVP